MATVRANDHIAYSPHLLLMSAVFATKLPTKKASVSIILNMNKIFIFYLIRLIRVQKEESRQSALLRLFVLCGCRHAIHFNVILPIVALLCQHNVNLFAIHHQRNIASYIMAANIRCIFD